VSVGVVFVLAGSDFRVYLYYYGLYSGGNLAKTAAEVVAE